VYPYEDGAIADGHITICRLRPDVNLRYVVEFLRSESGQIQMLRHVCGSTGQTELLVDHIRSLRIPIPSPEIQKEVVRLMDEARAQSDELLRRGQALREESANMIAAARQRMMIMLTR